MTQTFPLDPKTSSSVILTLFTNLRNPQEIRENIKKGTVNFAAIKPELIYDAFQVVVAANKAVCSEKLTTKSVHSEILFNLSFSKNITQSFQKFGLEENAKNVLIGMVVKDNEIEEAKKQLEYVQGDIVDLSRLHDFCNVESVKKAYKLTECEMKNLNVLDSIISRISAKDVIL